jgi:sigma-B regulation protein RsbU (phosphoserine phosphatase)
VLGRLDQQVQHFEPETMATALLRCSNHRLSGCTCPQRAIRHRYLPCQVTLRSCWTCRVTHPVDVPGGLRRRATTINLPPGALLCFYTDGLVERRDICLMPADSACASW